VQALASFVVPVLKKVPWWGLAPPVRPTGSVKSNDLLGAKVQSAPRGIAMGMSKPIAVTHECPGGRGGDQITIQR
jgi:hypothetical protein